MLERRALPRMDLATVLGQSDSQAALHEPTERTACLELGQLAMVTDEDELAAHRGCRVDELGKPTRRDHSGLVDHEHATLRQLGRAPRMDRAEQRGNACAR